MNNLDLKGILPVNKPQGWTSFDVVNKIKHIIYQKGLKIGHLGTLDPMATGVLLVTVGKATKLFDLMQQKSKTYLATFEFGYETDTLDAMGTKVFESANLPTRQQIEEILPSFIGQIEQMPPKYSAKSINGKRAYDLARANQQFDLKPCKVNIYDLDIIDFGKNYLTLKVVCGSGTYIRAIGRDIAEKLKTYATMTSLIRTDIDNFNIKNCVDIQSINEQNIAENMFKIKNVLSQPVLKLGQTETGKILNGQSVKIEKDDGLYQLIGENDTIALVQIKDFNAKMSIFLA